MRDTWSTWKVAGFSAILAFFGTVIVYLQQYPVTNLSDLFVQCLTVAAIGGWSAALLVMMRNRHAARGRHGGERGRQY
jgi:hypothetical protein